MSAPVLRLTPAVREAVKDARAIERRLHGEGAAGRRRSARRASE
jgi:hypothetical protein